jgi:hypothetical protein
MFIKVMFQNLMTGPYSAAANQDAAYIQAVYRPHPQYGSDHDQSIRSSPSWNSASANVVQQTSNESNHAFPSNHSASPFSARFPFQVIAQQFLLMPFLMLSKEYDIYGEFPFKSMRILIYLNFI